MKTAFADGIPAVLEEDEVRGMERRWAPLLEGIKKARTRRNTAILFENQANSMRGLTEATTTANIGTFTKFIFPIIRRTFPNLIANDIVSVQPMTGPVGGIFFWKMRYADDKGQVTAGDELIKDFNRHYASNFIDGEAAGTGDNVTKIFKTVAKWRPVKTKSLVVKVFDDSAGTTLQVGSDVGGTGVIASDDGTFTSGKINYVTGEITLTFSTAPDVDDKVTLEYKYNNELNTRIPAINREATLIAVTAESRKLKSLWSQESEDDLRALVGLSMQPEVAADLSSEVALEIDRTIITEVEAGVTASNSTIFDAAVPTGIPDLDHFKNIIVPINRISNLIHKATFRGPANWLVTSPEVSAILDSLPFFERTDPSENVYTGGVIKVGTLQRKWTVYKDPYFTTNKILVGRQGANFLDTGYVWAPYIPLQVSPAFLDPNDLSFRQAVRTRFATKLVRPEFFGEVIINNLPV